MITMILPNRHVNVLTIFLLVVQLCLPVYGPVYFSDFLTNIESSHTGFVCAHADVDSAHESQNSHQHIAHCYELDEPGDITSGLVIDHWPVISTLTPSDKGVLLHGYDAPIDIPPENVV